MKSLLLLIAATVGVALVDGQEGFVCDIPTAGCSNGMFNQALCECECIKPFCHDVNGDCTNPSDNCGDNPWEQCTRGVNCPWWVNPMKAESCTTGPTVPLGLWDIFSTREACCNTNFAYSEFCDVKPDSSGPTKHPTIAAPEDDIYEVIPIKFDVMGLPDTITMRDLKDEMATVLKRILLRLAKSIPGLKISNVEEKVVLNRVLMKALHERALEKDVTLYFNVFVIRESDKKFGPLIIAEIRDHYDKVLDQIQSFADTKYFGADLKLNWCTSQNGKFELCVNDVIEKPRTRGPAKAPTPVVIQSDVSGDEGGGLPGWAIALIIIVALLLLCCISYAIYASCRNNDESNEIHNNIYMDDKSKSRVGSLYGRSRGINDTYFVDEKSQPSGSRSRQSRRTRQSHRSHHNRSHHNNDDEVQIVLAQPQDPQFDDDSFTINTYGTKKTKRLARDPTMYVPGREDRPDPHSSFGGEETSRRQYLEDPPLRPKRDPTMYVGGQEDPSLHGEGNYDSEDPPLKPKREPTMYVDGESAAEYSVGRGGASMGGYSGDSYAMGGIDEDEEYDQYGFKQSDLDGEYMTSETNAEYARGSRDPSYYVHEEQSFRSQERSVAKSSKQKKSKKSKKSSRSAK